MISVAFPSFFHGTSHHSLGVRLLITKLRQPTRWVGFGMNPPCIRKTCLFPAFSILKLMSCYRDGIILIRTNFQSMRLPPALCSISSFMANTCSLNTDSSLNPCTYLGRRQLRRPTYTSFTGTTQTIKQSTLLWKTMSFSKRQRSAWGFLGKKNIRCLGLGYRSVQRHISTHAKLEVTRRASKLFNLEKIEYTGPI
jgi:hypothetical protein